MTQSPTEAYEQVNWAIDRLREMPEVLHSEALGDIVAVARFNLPALKPPVQQPAPVGEEDWEAVLKRCEAANQMISDLCQRRREWQLMSIPARPGHDPDLVISAALADIPKLIAALAHPLTPAKMEKP